MTMDFDRQTEEMNISHAIKGTVQRKLTEILPVLTKQKLSSLAAEHEISGRSKMNKSDLVS